MAGLHLILQDPKYQQDILQCCLKQVPRPLQTGRGSPKRWCSPHDATFVTGLEPPCWTPLHAAWTAPAQRVICRELLPVEHTDSCQC